MRIAAGVGAALAFVSADIAHERLTFVVRAIIRMWSASGQVHCVPALRTDRLIINAKTVPGLLLK